MNPDLLPLTAQIEARQDDLLRRLEELEQRTAAALAEVVAVNRGVQAIAAATTAFSSASSAERKAA